MNTRVGYLIRDFTIAVEYFIEIKHDQLDFIFTSLYRGSTA